MENLNRIIKNTLLFLVIFLVVNAIMQSCQNKPENLEHNAGNLVFITSDNEYSRTGTVKVNLTNNTKETIVVPNDCPGEPLNVYRYENNEWVQKTSTPKIACDNTTPFKLAPGKEYEIVYTNWSHSLFSEMGRFKISFDTKYQGETKTFTTNEFMVVKEGVMSQLWNGLIYRPIYNALIFFTATIPGHDLGLAIIILTLIIKTILLIPSQKALKSQKKMQEIQPRLEKIKEKYKGDQQKIAMETMQVWKEANVSPVGSCLPILLQFPFLIAVFYVIQKGLNPDYAYLLYTEYANFSLSDVNTNFLGILELTKINLYVLPLLVGALQFVQMKMAMSRKPVNTGKMQNELMAATNMMTYIMPVMIAVFTASVPAGVGLYWGISTLYGIGQQFVVNMNKTESKPDEPTVRVINN